MGLGIRLHLAGLSLLNTVRELEKFGVEHSHKAVHDWVHKCYLQPADDEGPNHVALDKTVIPLDEYRYWLYTAVDPETNSRHCTATNGASRPSFKKNNELATIRPG